MTQPKFKIKRGDLVQVTAGKDKGKQGQVMKILLCEARAVVEGINLVTRNQKPSATNPGGPVQKNLSIHISNLAVVDLSSGKPGRVGYKIHEGQKVRFFKKTGNVL
jgi:large subunit ribosomal protein L24